jgi:peptide/nickel transport system substrate-binding protein
MGRALIARRSLLLGAIAAPFSARVAGARGRIPVTGRLVFTLPWPLERLDPHDGSDAVAALFGHAAFDTVLAPGPAGEPYPTLAVETPAVVAGRTTLHLRPGLVTARGKPILARDVVFSVERARSLGAYPWWGDLPLPLADARDPCALSFATADAPRVARALANPFLAIVPRGFDARVPDGTGAMRADFSPGRLTLSRNAKAARGASYLEQIVVSQATDLSASLRAFEAGSADLGWLGAGLHAPRPGAVAFDAGSAGFVVLRTGSEAGPWSAPGVAQQILDALPRERMQHLGLGAGGQGPPGTKADWGGPPCDLIFAAGGAQLAELARVLASLLSRPGHEIELRPVPADDLARRRAASTFALMLDVVRAPGGPGLPTLVALTQAASPKAALDLVRRPPNLASFAPEVVTRTLRLGVVGELRIVGAAVPDVRIATGRDGWDLASTFRARRRAT